MVRQAGGPPVLDRSVTLLLLVDEEGDVPVTVDLVNFFLQLAGERVWVGALLRCIITSAHTSAVTPGGSLAGAATPGPELEEEEEEVSIATLPSTSPSPPLMAVVWSMTGGRDDDDDDDDAAGTGFTLLSASAASAVG